ncbi:methyltransferase family protein [Brevundimonas naejangsanensis]|uniref:methyltransferase family protein n=1 Tax=Brevundimonas naejangsanensis TaxID=588932 RepID=UPI001F09AA27|nr:isoprenylcysteine carboxylmethyltransferase family protein [Brevundimonas naejangsanensis]
MRKIALAAALAVILGLAFVTRPNWGSDGLHEGLEAVGLCLIVICIVGRAWCSLYIGGRKKAEIVDRGPYSISRNPLYIFSFMGAFGVGAQTGSLTMATMFLVLTVAVFYATVKREEAWLSGAFGEAYAAYCARTPRFGPDFSKWRDVETLDVRPRFFLTTLRDGLVFLLAVPLFESVERLQDLGWLSTLIHLP